MLDSTPVYIKEVLIKDFKNFKGENRFIFCNENDKWHQWTVFLGNNNSGKTNLLRAIACLEPEKIELLNERYIFDIEYISKAFRMSSFPGKGSTIALKTTVSDDAASKKEITAPFNNYYKVFDFVNIIGGKSTTASNPQFANLSIFGYGIQRYIEKKGISADNSQNSNSDNLFNNTKLINFEDWLFQLDYAANNKNAQKEYQEKAAAKRDLLIEILTSEIFPEISNIRFSTDKKLNNHLEYKTSEGWYKLSELGYGYQATLAWTMDFCKHLFDKYPDSKNPLKEPAVLLIDEIDLHLHPHWQRTITKYLSNIFTRTQFIVTTHSPFVLQSMENVNLYTLYSENGRAKAKYWGIRSFTGWRVEEILSEVMGLEDNVQPDIYLELMDSFDKALDTDNYSLAKKAYEKLDKILHPQSPERKILDIQLSQLLPDNDKA